MAVPMLGEFLAQLHRALNLAPKRGKSSSASETKKSESPESDSKDSKDSKATKGSTSSGPKKDATKGMTKAGFLAHAESFTLTGSPGDDIEVAPTKFSSGTLGWGANGKTTITVVDGAETREIPVNFSISYTIPKSKELPAGDATSKGATKGKDVDDDDEDSEEAAKPKKKQKVEVLEPASDEEVAPKPKKKASKKK
ncbi:hypothetical protein RQP46_006428 [Phenoliferia psychrophenolica]